MEWGRALRGWEQQFSSYITFLKLTDFSRTSGALSPGLALAMRLGWFWSFWGKMWHQEVSMYLVCVIDGTGLSLLFQDLLAHTAAPCNARTAFIWIPVEQQLRLVGYIWLGVGSFLTAQLSLTTGVRRDWHISKIEISKLNIDKTKCKYDLTVRIPWW